MNHVEVKEKLTLRKGVKGNSFYFCKLPTAINWGIQDFTAPYRRWLEGMRMLEGIDARTETVMDVDQVVRENLN